MAQGPRLPIYDPTCQECPHQGATYRTNVDSHHCHMDPSRKCVGHAMTKKNPPTAELVRVAVIDGSVTLTRNLPALRRGELRGY